MILQHPVKAILFDLDGTLIDTAGDLGQALNGVLTARGLKPLPLAAIRPFAGRGCKGLLKLGLNIEETHSDYAAHCDELLSYYQHHIVDTTALFPGMDAVLSELEKRNCPWGVVTNKPERFTLPVMEALQLTSRAACIISGDSLTNRKPHPEPILHACDRLQIKPADCLYIGDSEIDIIASKAAGTSSIVAMYGYIPDEENPTLWNADGYIHHPLELLQSL